MKILSITTTILIFTLVVISVSAEWKQGFKDRTHSSLSQYPLGGGRLTTLGDHEYQTQPHQYLVHDIKSNTIFVNASVVTAIDSELSVVWRFDLPADVTIEQPVLGDTTDQYINVYGASAGPTGISSLYAVANGVQVFQEEIYAQDASGVWTSVDGPKSDGNVYIYILSIVVTGTNQQKASLAITVSKNGEFGNILGRKDFPEFFTLTENTKPIAIDDFGNGYFLLGFNGQAYAVSYDRQAKENWNSPVKLPGPIEFASVDGITPDNNVFVCAQYQQTENLMILDRLNGSVIREILNVGCFCGMVKDRQSIYTCGSSFVARVNLTTGSIMWKSGYLKKPTLIVGSDDAPVVLSATNFLLSFHPTSGAIISSLPIAATEAQFASLSASAGTIYVNRGDKIVTVGCCSRRGLCHPNGTCQCQEHFFGEDCSKYCKMDDNCKHGHCNQQTGQCQCDKGYAGDKCDIVCPLSCSSNGHCVAPNGKPECACSPQYFDNDCGVFCQPQQSCSQHGSCMFDGSCKCDQGYFSSNCSVFCDPSVQCSTNGICDPITGSCTCKLGYYGPKCNRMMVLPIVFSLAGLSILLTAIWWLRKWRTSQASSSIEKQGLLN